MTIDHPRVIDAIEHEELLRFVDGALDDDGRVRVLTYLASHPEAVEQVEAYLHQNAQLRALREHLALSDSAAFAAPLQAALAARLSARARRGGQWRVSQRYGIAAGVAFMLAAGVIGYSVDRPAREVAQGQQTVAHQPGGPVVPASEPYFPFDRTELAVASVDEARADDEVFNWLAGHVSDFSLSAPDLDRIGLSLVGAETLRNANTPAIRVLYRDAAGDPVVLYAGIGRTDANHAFWLVREGYLSLQWRRGPMIFAFVAPSGSPQLSAMVELVGAAVARLPMPERNEQVEAQLTPQPAPPAPPAVAAPIETTGPVQVIGIPLARPTLPLARPAPPSVPSVPLDAGETINPDILPEATAANEPKPL